MLSTISHGYEHCKVVGRGRAVANVLSVMEVVKRRLPDFSFYMSETKSLNKSGQVCDEIHVLISAPRKGGMEGSNMMEGPSRMMSRNGGGHFNEFM